MIVAVIDLGSNSARMGIYERLPDQQHAKKLQELRFPVRLSEGILLDNLLKKPAMERTMLALTQMKAVAMSYGDIPIKCIATEAMRRALNADVFQKAVLEQTGIAIEIIDGEAETLLGIESAKLSTSCNSFYMLDTGGGSFELALCENGKLVNHACLPYGAVVLTEMFHPDTNGAKAVFSFITEKLDALPWVCENGYPVVLLGGSNRMLGKIYHGASSDSHLNGNCIPVQDAMHLIDKIIAMPYDEREKLVGMEKNRIDIITAGLAPLRSLLIKSKSENLILCTNSSRDVLAAKMLCGSL